MSELQVEALDAAYGSSQVLARGTADEIRTNQDVIDAYLGTDHHAAQASAA